MLGRHLAERRERPGPGVGEQDVEPASLGLDRLVQPVEISLSVTEPCTYVGCLVWNRQRFIKDPTIGRRVARRNPESEWIRTEVPKLRIIGVSRDYALQIAARATSGSSRSPG